MRNPRLLLLFTFILLQPSLVPYLSSATFADTHLVKGEEVPDKVCGDVQVDVRALKGIVQSESEPEQKPLVLDPRIQDLRNQLLSLQYDAYRLITHRREVIPLTTKKVIKLGAGHRLTLRPLYVKKKRVGMWMKWKDPQGAKIIDTRMHFDCGQQMLTGMEENADRGLVLAIQVDPYYR